MRRRKEPLPPLTAEEIERLTLVVQAAQARHQARKEYLETLLTEGAAVSEETVSLSADERGTRSSVFVHRRPLAPMARIGVERELKDVEFYLQEDQESLAKLARGER